MVRQLHPADLADKWQRGERPLMLDVRHPWEYQIVAFPEATLIPLHELPSRLDELEVPKETPIVVYCHHGIRSLSGAAILEAAGFQDVVSLAGGIDLWSQLIDPKMPKY